MSDQLRATLRAREAELTRTIQLVADLRAELDERDMRIAALQQLDERDVRIAVLQQHIERLNGTISQLGDALWLERFQAQREPPAPAPEPAPEPDHDRDKYPRGV